MSAKPDGVVVELDQRRGSEISPLPEYDDLLASATLSLTVLREQLAQSEVASLVKVAGLIQDHESDLPAYLSSDSRGKLVPRFLIQLATQLAQENELFRREHAQLARNIELLRQRLGLETLCGSGRPPGRGAEFQGGGARNRPPARSELPQLDLQTPA